MKELIETYKAQKESFVEKAREEVKKEFKKIFDDNENLKTIHWTQYTPYFNDGDTCTFRVNDFAYTNMTEDLESVHEDIDLEEEGGNWQASYVYEYMLKEGNLPDVGINWKQLIEFQDLMTGSEMEDIFLDLFGDHVHVIATREGFEIEEYEHD